MLDAATLERELTARGARLGRPLVVRSITGSTNDDARAAALEGAPHGATFVADAQTRGRGRGNHRWHSPPGENVYLSVVLRLELSGEDLPLVTLAVGIAVARVVERHAGAHEVGIKWPNDVLVGRAKIAGILVEGHVRGERAAFLVAGIGLNVGTRSFPPELDGRATSLVALGRAAPPRETIVAELLVEIDDVVTMLARGGRAALVAELSRRDLLRGRTVRAGDVRGVGGGIDDSGRLVVERGDGERCAIVSGEVDVTW